MSTHNIYFQDKSSLIIPYIFISEVMGKNLNMKRLINEFEIAVINEPAMFEQSNSYHFTLSDVETFFFLQEIA